jgi:SAM-dependent methyltransferase
MQNLRSNIQSLTLTMGLVQGYKEQILWLLDLNENYDSIANFGCNIGYETLALMWLLNAREATGVDKDGDSIRQAQSLLSNIQMDIQSIQMALHYNPNIPSQFRSELQSYVENLGHLPFPTFVEGDMTEMTSLPSNHFDLAYCERVLYHIACNRSGRVGDNVLSAVEEMARVVKPGGFVAAIEPNICSPDDNRAVELQSFFERVGLSSLQMKNPTFLLEEKTVYAYLKSA